MDYEICIGLETHVQVKTRTKVFCACPTEFGAEPNTNVCPVCLGYPGSLPVINEEAVRKTVLAGLLVGAKIARYSKFDRKNYFYPDMPKNYQISQYDLPLVIGGQVEFDYGVVDKKRAGKTKVVRLTRIHLEEDVGKSFHFERTSGVDFNRAGTPLMEIVSEPEISSPDEAFAYLTALKEILIYGGISDCDMEKGQVRCDVNISLRPLGATEFGAKVEIKNMNTFSGVRRALEYEARRQIETLKRGGTLVQETRRWDDVAGITESMRVKEHAHDYRYFPEPDLLPMALSEAWLAEVRKRVPELPGAKRKRLESQYGVSAYDARVLSGDRALADFFESAARQSRNPKSVANWVINDLLRELAGSNLTIAQSPVTAAHIVELVELVDSGRISSRIAKDVFAEAFQSGKAPGVIVSEKGLAQVSDADAIERFCDEVITANPKMVADFKACLLYTS
ncbi:MAG: Asp-tRNA(Asn)/Glu-tRNA(Gln) amidotransferase subunit GatB, partial [Verrucomicrobiae bacterium]|nr:Asp-tRNA(Asn)/Glu-tRNA(Gln) amidotransferase subunit GatB [Verrucomicrobiae bacterium]